MKKPEMIIFDLGHTLLLEPDFNSARGDIALLQYAVKNPSNCTLEDIRRENDRVFEEAEEITRLLHFDIPCVTCQRLAFEHLGIEFSLTPLEREIVWWSAATPGAVVPYADTMLDYLNAEGIRTAVLSNNGWTGGALKERIDRLLPNNRFEFIISSCDYLIRKPDKRLCEIALHKAGLTADKVWYCGDSIKSDVYGSRNAGLFPVLFDGNVPIGNSFDHKNEGLTIDFAYLHIHDWMEMVDVLNTLV